MAFTLGCIGCYSTLRQRLQNILIMSRLPFSLVTNSSGNVPSRKIPFPSLPCSEARQTTASINCEVGTEGNIRPFYTHHPRK